MNWNRAFNVLGALGLLAMLDCQAHSRDSAQAVRTQDQPDQGTRPVKVTDSRGMREAEKKRTNAIDADIARYGESYARISISPNGGLQMEHVPRNLVRPVFAIAPPPASKPE